MRYHGVLAPIDNFDERVDFDSDGKGDDNFVELNVVKVNASGNADEAIKASEEAKGTGHPHPAAADNTEQGTT
jgi:hypothetical protein